MSDFTKGPWVASLDLDTIYGSNNEEIVTCAGIGTSIREDRANARLIAESPTMFEYLEDLASCGDVRAKEIIAKAEGKQ